MFNKIKYFLLIALLFLPLSFQKVSAEESVNEQREIVNVYFFWGKGCPHCEKEKVFLKKLAQKYPQIKIKDFEVWGSKDNQKLLKDFDEKLNANVSGVPFTVIGEEYVSGWMNEEYTGKKIEEMVICHLNKSCKDIGEEILGVNQEADNKKEDKKVNKLPEKITLPLLGEIETKNFSLPILTIVMGSLDGFNPCAMWALLFLITLLLGMENRKRMWILGIAFIITSALVYFLFMTAWLKLILFIGIIFWIRILIGAIAIGGGSYNLKEYFTNKEGACKVTNNQRRREIFEKLKKITQHQSFYWALGGIILLAFAVNLVELICSAGLPAVYTQILTLSELATWQYYMYLILYILFFMIDDLFVFFVSMKTLQVTGITTKYSRWSHLIGGILMIIIGLLLIFKHEWLMFG
jgi:cytochrome c biogenesis protein CcdA/thiol-disulfide isomerase/thioredoxin